MKWVEFSMFLFVIFVQSNCDDDLYEGTDQNTSTEPALRISMALKKFIQTGNKSNSLPLAISDLHAIKNKTLRDQQSCKTCRLVVDNVIKYRQDADKNAMVILINYLCMQFSSQGKVGCDGIVDLQIDSILYIIDNRRNLTGSRACAIHFQYMQCEDPDSEDWDIDIPPDVNNNADFMGPVNNDSPEKFLHLTDIHFDPLYKPGSNALCNEPLCCQTGKPLKPDDVAGYWGDYHVCDTPWHAILDLMEQVKKEHMQIDYVYYTGDIISHMSWATSKEENALTVHKLFDEFWATFGQIPVYPILGNHEAHPSDFYSPANVSSNKISTQWLFNLVAEEWSRWLPAETKGTILKGGYYTILVKKGFRIIALNSNVCYISNLWLIYDDNDQYGQLKWLVDTLKMAEENGEFVHILSHIPPGGTECWQKWSRQFNKIITRFSNTIKAQFNGHTHLDEIRIFLDANKEKAINVAYNGGSFTTFVGYNPNYRIYDVNPSTYEVLDYDHWIYNLSDANKHKDQPPTWYKLYSFKDAYGMKSMQLEDLYDLVQRMGSDTKRTLLKQYYRFEGRESVPHMATKCDAKCLDSLFCSITGVEFEDAVKCEI